MYYFVLSMFMGLNDVYGPGLNVLQECACYSSTELHACYSSTKLRACYSSTEIRMLLQHRNSSTELRMLFEHRTAAMVFRGLDHSVSRIRVRGSITQ